MLPEARLSRRNEVGDTADVILSKKWLPEWQGIETFQRGEGGWLPLGPIGPADALVSAAHV